jgi:hypothetical protein
MRIAGLTGSVYSYGHNLVSIELHKFCSPIELDRRDFLKVLSAGTVATMSGQLAFRLQEPLSANVYEDIPTRPEELAQSLEYMTTPSPDAAAYLRLFRGRTVAHKVKASELDQYLEKMHNFETEHFDDVYLDPGQFSTLISAFKRMDRVQVLVGHGNFNILSFDDMLKHSAYYESVGAFPRHESDFLAELFSANAHGYGFHGEKVITELTARVPEADVVKVSLTGHFLYKGDSVRLYEKVKTDVGDIELTSGIRSVVKQTHLFMAKTIQAKGNLSRASRSLAPPGHSFHGIGDFDVGKVGYGPRNFTDAFAQTDEFKRLVDLGYVNIRYPRDNLMGVRYEPWHIKVV